MATEAAQKGRKELLRNHLLQFGLNSLQRCRDSARDVPGKYISRCEQYAGRVHWGQDLPSYMLYAYFDKLTGVPYKRVVQIGEETHTVIMEKNRMQLFTAVQQFLDEKFVAGK